MNITFFKNIHERKVSHTTSVKTALNRIREGASKNTIEAIRKKQFVGEDYDDLKKTLPCVTFSASEVQETESGSLREDSSVKKHSGLLPLDFDDVEDTDIKIQQLQNDPYMYAVWLSPSGTGVRALVKCPPSIENHSVYYTSLLDRYPDLDKTSRNISRVTFESYDPDIYVNEGSLIWDKKTTEEARQKVREQSKNRKGTQVIATAVAMIRASYDGTKHSDLHSASLLVGGYVAANRVDEESAIRVLEDEIRAKMPKDMKGAQKTIRDGIEAGKKRPLMEAKKIEQAQQYLRREDGGFDFLADEDLMDKYERASLNGELEMGKPTGLKGLNQYWLFKKNSLVMFVGTASVGKSFVIWFLSVLAAKFHKWKFIMQSAENEDGEVRKKIKEFYLGKSLKLASSEELADAAQFVKNHFRIISCSEMHDWIEFMTKCELVIDEGFEADCVIGEPYNSFTVPAATDQYRHNLHVLNHMRVFKAKYCGIWFADHVSTFAARNKDKKTKEMLMPSLSDAEMGVMKKNKIDEGLIIHRTLGEDNKWEILIGVEKIRSKETGGDTTIPDKPVVLKLNRDFCSYTSEGVDPINRNRTMIQGNIGEQFKMI